MNWYFDVREAKKIESIETLLSLNLEKDYYRPGDLKSPPLNDWAALSSAHKTAGIFRGQIENWPLVPKCFRKDVKDVVDSPVTTIWQTVRAMRNYSEFCKRAEVQNSNFPASEEDRMSIAQHFGVDTPYLDWSRSIFTAIFFSIRDVMVTDDFGEKLKVYIYHVVDERLLTAGSDVMKNFPHIQQSSFIEPYRFDRRIERQRGVFTLHPHPAERPAKVPATVYVITWELIEKLLPLMEGFGFTEDYYFPDYAGIAGAVMSKTGCRLS